MSREGEAGAARKRRHSRVRKHLSGLPERPRLCVFRSLKHIYAQVIDDTCGHTLVSASSLDPELRAGLEGKPRKEKAEQVGTLVAKRAKSKGITDVVFDRGGCKYHGRVNSLADGARSEGLRF
jgi:large subunit ribosomal protein L18